MKSKGFHWAGLCFAVAMVIMFQACDKETVVVEEKTPPKEVTTTKAAVNEVITVVDRPAVTERNDYYVSNREPLAPSVLIKLPVGSVEADGWLLSYLERQRNGLTGNLGKISAWLQKNDNAWLSDDGKGKWGWEELPYWLKGYGNIGYLLNDAEMIAETKIWIEGALNSQRENGDFGPVHHAGGGRDYWGNMIMLYCLQSYYEYTGDQRVLDLMTKYFKYQLTVPDEKFLTAYWQRIRGGDNLHSAMWLYNRTGDAWLLDLAKKIHRNTADWTSRGHDRGIIKCRKHKRSGTEWPEWFGDQIDWHNVNHAQCFREPAQFYLLSRDPKDLQATYDNFKIIRDYFGQVPGGMFGGDENCRPGYDDPRQGIETCGIVEQMNSNEHLLRITGDTFWADHCEEVAFNTYPASTMADFKSLHYLTSPNMVVCDQKNHAPGIDNRGPFLIMNPFSSRCCQHNHAQGWPYFVENLWMATPDNGVCAVMYSASSVKVKVGDGTEVRIIEQSNYPFEEQIRFVVKTPKALCFPLYLRIPGWCENASVRINNSKVSADLTAGKFIRIERTWKAGDVVTLDVPMQTKVRTWAKNHNSVSVDYGPLTFSLKIKENYVKFDSVETAIHDSKWQKGADTANWPSWEIRPASAWNYGLLLNINKPELSFKLSKKPWPADNFPFTTDSMPLVMTAKAVKIPEWSLDEHGLCAELQDSPVQSNQPIETVELIPMGAARLRISAFPVIGNDANAKKWRESEPPAEYEMVVPTSKQQPATWHYTFEKPAGGWFKSDFDCKGWKQGKGMFGTKGTPNVRVGTEWNGSDIWMRREFKLDSITPDLKLAIFYDEDAKVYINGVLALEVKGYTTDYAIKTMSEAAFKSLYQGSNTIAVHCKNTTGGQGIDVGVAGVVKYDKFGF